MVAGSLERRRAGQHVRIGGWERFAGGVCQRQCIAEQVECAHRTVLALLEHLLLEDLDSPPNQLEVLRQRLAQSTYAAMLLVVVAHGRLHDGES
ncbi:MAG: hypothetical protein E6I75_18805 [Chloroflexi bacterium]|nr:MAG: hypothetical protein E6I75_18805 [Chloroflexota bacterium]